MDGVSNLMVFGFTVVLIVGFILMIFFVLPNNDGGTQHENHPARENFDASLPADFLVFNYFPKNALKMEAVMPNGHSTVLIKRIEPLKTKSLTRSQVRKYLTPGSIFRFKITGSSGEDITISDYIVNNDTVRKLKNLHVGMITTRYIFNTSDGLELATTSANAGGGNAWLVIHNLTSVPLSFNNGEVKVAPHSTTRYLGYLNQGVTLGTYFKDDAGIYPDFQYLWPHNSLYYGVVSDLQQPLLGCMQYGEFNDQCDYGQTLWPLQQGVI